MPTKTSVTYCPHCGKPSKMFEQTTDLIHYDHQSASVFSEAIMFATQFGVITGGAFLTIWGLDWSVFWLAPTVGVTGAIGLSVWAVAQRSSPLPPPTDLNLVIDVTEKKGIARRRTIRDVFEGCRPAQLWKLAHAHINEGIPLTRRAMAKCGVSQGQFERVRDTLVEYHWADLDGDHDTATAVPNWSGKAILRGILAEFPTPPSLYLSSLVAHPPTTPPPPHQCS